MRGTPAERFWAKVNKTDECWLWTGARTAQGYGNFGVKPGQNVYAHRFARELLGLPLGEETHHTCPNKNCVNPDHNKPTESGIHQALYHEVKPHGLTLVNAEKTHCVRGHLLEGDNLYKSQLPRRVCRACSKERYASIRNGKLS